MAGPLGSWWRLAARSSAPAEQLEDLDDILREPGADADLPVSSGSSSKLLESPQKQPQHWHACGGPAAATQASSISNGSSGSTGGSWSSYLPSVAGHDTQPQHQGQQHQAGAAAAAAATGAPTALWRHLLPASLGGSPAEAAPAPAAAPTPSPAAAAAVGNPRVPPLAPPADPTSSIAVATANATATAAAWAAAAQYQLSSAWDVTATSVVEHVTAGSMGATALGAAVGGVAGLAAGPLGVAVGAKSGAALGAIGGAALKHACDKRESSTLAALAAKAGAERELQPMSAASSDHACPKES